MDDPTKQIVGVVSHILAEGIIFEFQNDDKLEIGIVRPRDILVFGQQLQPGKEWPCICPHLEHYNYKLVINLSYIELYKSILANTPTTIT